ncbi:MAG TPA: DnaA/Hda family protein, partial [Burkholderiales bacterium]|nr:DnaA/Hda family protein [Burkholderiales bacterium]
GFDNFVAGANAEALAAVRALASGTLREPIVYLWGPPGSGRSHLLKAAQRANPRLAVADDVQTLDAHAQQALFAAINRARDAGPGVLAAGDRPPAGLSLREDLRSRLAWGLAYELHPLGDEAKAAHLAALAARRGLELPPEVAAYLLARLPRDFASLNRIMEALDKHSLARQRGLTLPLVREALAAWEANGLMPRQGREA